ncbi:hypothetical protein CDCA_CDCA06G1851 [Cyanidium caldarium]|uniref:Uncharacterized protein n=1 Tax=Cyanidium caldarium TaxID=2771 RepID=A0AAV9IUT5_CYACA|nr:hypothetical protein CDCA_CDCA06G1851 [Cyanidium caldarium]
MVITRHGVYEGEGREDAAAAAAAAAQESQQGTPEGGRRSPRRRRPASARAAAKRAPLKAVTFEANSSPTTAAGKGSETPLVTRTRRGRRANRPAGKSATPSTAVDTPAEPAADKADGNATATPGTIGETAEGAGGGARRTRRAATVAAPSTPPDAKDAESTPTAGPVRARRRNQPPTASASSPQRRKRATPSTGKVTKVRRRGSAAETKAPTKRVEPITSPATFRRRRATARVSRAPPQPATSSSRERDTSEQPHTPTSLLWRLRRSVQRVAEYLWRRPEPQAPSRTSSTGERTRYRVQTALPIQKPRGSGTFLRGHATAPRRPASLTASSPARPRPATEEPESPAVLAMRSSQSLRSVAGITTDMEPEELDRDSLRPFPATYADEEQQTQPEGGHATPTVRQRSDDANDARDRATSWRQWLEVASFRELQAEAKRAGVSGGGTTSALRQRLGHLVRAAPKATKEARFTTHADRSVTDVLPVTGPVVARRSSGEQHPAEAERTEQPLGTRTETASPQDIARRVFQEMGDRSMTVQEYEQLMTLLRERVEGERTPVMAERPSGSPASERSVVRAEETIRPPPPPPPNATDVLKTLLQRDAAEMSGASAREWARSEQSSSPAFRLLERSPPVWSHLHSRHGVWRPAVPNASWSAPRQQPQHTTLGAHRLPGEWPAPPTMNSVSSGVIPSDGCPPSESPPLASISGADEPERAPRRMPHELTVRTPLVMPRAERPPMPSTDRAMAGAGTPLRSLDSQPSRLGQLAASLRKQRQEAEARLEASQVGAADATPRHISFSAASGEHSAKRARVDASTDSAAALRRSIWDGNGGDGAPESPSELEAALDRAAAAIELHSAALRRHQAPRTGVSSAAEVSREVSAVEGSMRASRDTSTVGKPSPMAAIRPERRSSHVNQVLAPPRTPPPLTVSLPELPPRPPSIAAPPPWETAEPADKEMVGEGSASAEDAVLRRPSPKRRHDQIAAVDERVEEQRQEVSRVGEVAPKSTPPPATECTTGERRAAKGVPKGGTGRVLEQPSVEVTVEPEHPPASTTPTLPSWAPAAASTIDLRQATPPVESSAREEQRPAPEASLPAVPESRLVEDESVPPADHTTAAESALKPRSADVPSPGRSQPDEATATERPPIFSFTAPPPPPPPTTTTTISHVSPPSAPPVTFQFGALASKPPPTFSFTAPPAGQTPFVFGGGSCGDAATAVVSAAPSTTPPPPLAAAAAASALNANASAFMPSQPQFSFSFGGAATAPSSTSSAVGFPDLAMGNSADPIGGAAPPGDAEASAPPGRRFLRARRTRR